MNEQAATIEKPAPVSTPPKSPIFLVRAGIVLLIVTLLLIGTSGYIWRITFGHAQASIQQNLVETALLRQQLNALQSQLQQQQINLSESLKLNNQQIRQLSGDKKTWLLLEVDYLAQVANVQLLVNHNITATLTLLKTADQRLATFQGAQFFTIRQALATDISALQASVRLDKEGIIAQLSGLSDQANQLSVVPQKTTTKKIKTVQASSAVDTEKAKTLWKKAWHAFIAALQQIVVVHRRDPAIIPLLTPSEEILLRQNIVLLLQQAQWAVLNNQATLYKSSLQRAEQWIKQYFPNSRTANYLLARLEELQTMDVNPTLPTLTKTLEAIQKAKQVTTAKAHSLRVES